MRTLSVALSEDAEQDLDDAEWWVGERAQSMRVARAYGDRIRARCRRIGLVPQGGRERPDAAKRVRSVPFERSATIYYRVDSDRVLILRILRRGRDVERQFGR